MHILVIFTLLLDKLMILFSSKLIKLLHLLIHQCKASNLVHKNIKLKLRLFKICKNYKFLSLETFVICTLFLVKLLILYSQKLIRLLHYLIHQCEASSLVYKKIQLELRLVNICKNYKFLSHLHFISN